MLPELDKVEISISIIKLLVLLLIPAWVIVRSLWVTFPPPQGLRLNRHQVPHLFALVDELASKLQAPRFHNILLIQEINAAVIQIPRFGILGWQKNYGSTGSNMLMAS